jgi:DNA polymerase III subunit epsilon
VTGGPQGPPRGQKKMPWRTVELASLDFEATGLNFDRDRIISLGVVPIDDGRIDVGRSVYELVDPGEVALTGETVTIHGLRPIDVQGASSADAARETLRHALAGKFLITWYATVEASFLAKLFGTRPSRWLRRSIDVRKLVVGVLGAEAARLTLEQAAAHFDVPVASPHHALDDALVTAQLFLVTASKLGSVGARTPRDLMRVGAQTYRR